MEFTQYVMVGLVLAGVTELISRLRARDYWVVATIAICASLGGVFGYFNVEGIPSITAGIAVGFGVSGALKGISVLGQKTSPTPSTLTEVKK